MQMTKVACPVCHGIFAIADAAPRGKRIHCQKCGAAFMIGANELRPGQAAPPKVGILVSAAATQQARRNDSAAQQQRGGRWWLVVFLLVIAVVLVPAGAAVVAILSFNAGLEQAKLTKAAKAKDGSEPVAGNPDLKLEPKIPPAGPEPRNQGEPPADKAQDPPAEKKFDPPDPKKADPPKQFDPPPVKKAPPVEKREAPNLPADQQKAVNDAIDRGVKYLKSNFPADGQWPNSGYQQGTSALVGLTLLQCDVPATDPIIMKCTNVVRRNCMENRSTYETSLAILFLDKLGQISDKPLIQRMAMRLIAGQAENGGWPYGCELLPDLRNAQLLSLLLSTRGTPPTLGVSDPTRDDNSNTQFAMLALWAARRHDIPVENSLVLAARRFCVSQSKSGTWGYHMHDPEEKNTPAMSCVGLLGIALGKGAAAELVKIGVKPRDPKAPAMMPPGVDDQIGKGLAALDLAKYHFDGRSWPPDLSLYFVWSVERIGVMYNITRIQGRDWYQWGVGMLLPAQAQNGSWFTRSFLGSSPPIDTCLALLFLKRVNLVQDLTDLNLFTAITAPDAAAPGKR